MTTKLIQRLQDFNTKKKTVLLRLDFNVPIINGELTDASRIERTVPTIKFLLSQGAKVIIMSHFGRPNGAFKSDLSLENLIKFIEPIFNEKLIFLPNLDFKKINLEIESKPYPSLFLLENTRFMEGEEKNDIALSKELASLGDFFCNDAFSASHRKHASTVGIVKLLPSYSGLLLEKELLALSKALLNPKKPLVAIVGGSKVSTKITLLKNLVQKADHLIIGGGMANTFLHAKNKQIGRSLCEKNLSKLCKEILLSAKKFNCNIHLPIDIVCASNLKKKQQITTHNINFCPPDKMILDCGPNTVTKIWNILKKSNTLIWNGPLGAFETVPFNFSTEEVANLAAKLTKTDQLKSIAGGGDTLSALKSAEVLNDFSYVSYAGGAFLEWMEGKALPGIKALEENKDKNKNLNF